MAYFRPTSSGARHRLMEEDSEATVAAWQAVRDGGQDIHGEGVMWRRAWKRWPNRAASAHRAVCTSRRTTGSMPVTGIWANTRSRMCAIDRNPWPLPAADTLLKHGSQSVHNSFKPVTHCGIINSVHGVKHRIYRLDEQHLRQGRRQPR